MEPNVIPRGPGLKSESILGDCLPEGQNMPEYTLLEAGTVLNWPDGGGGLGPLGIQDLEYNAALSTIKHVYINMYIYFIYTYIHRYI